jgi:hypothetical protein
MLASEQTSERNQMLNKIKRRVGPVSLSLAAAALTAIGFAAVSFAAEDNGSSNQGNRSGDQTRGAPGGPPMIMQLSTEDREAMEEFRACMDEQGVEGPPAPPGPPPEGEEGDAPTDRFEHRLKPPSEEERAKMDEALEACEDKLPEGAGHIGPPCGPPPGGPNGEGTAVPGPPPSNRDS